jgi:hypothetical protein
MCTADCPKTIKAPLLMMMMMTIMDLLSHPV